MQKPHGLWPSPISAASLSGDLRLSDLGWDTYHADRAPSLVWLEGRSGRGVLQVVGLTGDAPRELTRDLDVRAEVGYGGGDFTLCGGKVYFVVRDTGRVYVRSLAGGPARPITPAFGQAASPGLSPDGRWLAYVHHYDGIDRLAIVDAEGAGWPQILQEGADFYMQPRWSPDGRELCFVAWNHPHMPWEAATLYRVTIGDVPGATPRLWDPEVVAGGKGTAVFQPEYGTDGRSLYYIADDSGWGQLWCFDRDSAQRRQITTVAAEYGLAAWGQGMRSYALCGEGAHAICAPCAGGVVRLERVGLQSGERQPIDALQEYTSVSQLTAAPRGSRFAFIGSSPTIPPRIVVHDIDGNTTQIIARSSAESVPAAALSPCTARSWETTDGETVHGMFYPPASDRFTAAGAPPLIVFVHGGPTDQVRAGWDPRTQYFTTRGYAVLWPNYRGSTGYGRAYLERLHGQWGVFDVEDVVTGARALAKAGDVDGKRMVIAGGSAGGYTVLQALIEAPRIFAAGICSYGVSDLFALCRDTHKFEARYGDWLVGPLPAAAEQYRERSPVFHADRIQRPVAVFQGADDKVVPRAQSEAIVAALKRSGVPHVYHLYEGEGHGFRQAHNLEHYYRAVEDFLLQYVIYA